MIKKASVIIMLSFSCIGHSSGKVVGKHVYVSRIGNYARYGDITLYYLKLNNGKSCSSVTSHCAVSKEDYEMLKIGDTHYCDHGKPTEKDLTPEDLLLENLES